MTVSLRMLHLNPRGWTSKQDSIVKLVNELKPDYINVNETQLQGKNEINLKAYNTFSKNRTDRIGGGICSAVASNLRQNAVCVGEGGEGDEWLAVRLDHVSPCITILNCYGEQEGRAGKEEVLARWGRLLKELEAIRARGDHCLLVGDLNKLVGDGRLGIPGNNPEVTAGGQMVRDLVESGNWVLINSMEEVVHKKRMCEDLNCGFKAEKEVFENVLDKFKKNGKKSYDFLIKASAAYQETVFSLCKRIIEKETIPQVFRNTTLHQIWKKKPGTKKEDLKANRYIHCKEWLPRTVEAMVVREMDQQIQKATSIFLNWREGWPPSSGTSFLCQINNCQERHYAEKVDNSGLLRYNRLL